MSFDDTIAAYDKQIEAKLTAFFERRHAAASEYHPFIGMTYDIIREFVLRKGKRIVSDSMLMMYEGYAGTTDDAILDVAAGMELYRHAILIHDDIADNDFARRGGPAAHIQFEQILNNNPDRFTASPERAASFGRSAALFAGNMLTGMAIETITAAPFAPSRIARVKSLIVGDYVSVNESQLLDLVFEHTEPTVDEWHVMASKRASSLFEASMCAGALLAGASEAEELIIRSAATHLGYAFDIQDDIIGTFGTNDQSGGKRGQDVAAGKKPLHIIHALHSDRADEVRHLLGIPDLSDDELETVTELLKENGLREARDESLAQAKKARDFISTTALNDTAKERVYSLINTVAESLDWYR